jgi:hypothetical protein
MFVDISLRYRVCYSYNRVDHGDDTNYIDIGGFTDNSDINGESEITIKHTITNESGEPVSKSLSNPDITIPTNLVDVLIEGIQTVKQSIENAKKHLPKD